MNDLIQRLRSLSIINPQIPGNNAGCHICGEAADEIERLQAQLVSVGNAGNQALRQWKMYADMMDGVEDFEKSAEGSVYLACKSLLSITGQRQD